MEGFDRAWERYERLMEERPELFVQSKELMIITDKEQVRRFADEHDRLFGVVYESAYSLLVVDLVESGGVRFAYERSVPASKGAIVSVPMYEGKYVLVKQYRHALRGWQINFPRGFGEQGISAEDNLRKEIMEELGAEVSDPEKIGSVYPDSGISSGAVDYFSCQISEPKLKAGYEGIRELILLTEEELIDGIRSGAIDDGFTLTAWALLKARKKQPCTDSLRNNKAARENA